jgi:hypothetical protein
MTQRITVAYLTAVIGRINRATGSPSDPYIKGEDGRYRGQTGCYHLSREYGGFCLHRMEGADGGVSDVFRCDHVPARDLANRMHAFLDGIEAQTARID